MWKDAFVAFLSTVITAMFGGILIILILHPPTLTESQMTLVQIGLGVLFSAFGGVWNFYLGSSSSSQKKDDTIHQAMVNANTNTNTNGNIGTVTVTGTESTSKPGTVTATGTMTKADEVKPKPTLVEDRKP